MRCDLTEADRLERQARAAMQKIAKAGLSIATAESCTGGLVSSLLTDIEGFSSAFDRGFVTYSEHSTYEMLGVPRNLITVHGVVSHEVALSMAQGRWPTAMQMCRSGSLALPALQGSVTKPGVFTSRLWRGQNRPSSAIATSV